MVCVPDINECMFGCRFQRTRWFVLGNEKIVCLYCTTAVWQERASLDREEARVIEKQRVGRNLQLAREREAASKRREARERTVKFLQVDVYNCM